MPKFLGIVLLIWILTLSLAAQQPSATASASSTAVPRLVNFGGSLRDASAIKSGVAGITFAIYRDEDGGAQLWLETQNVKLDASGHYSAQLGSSKAEGIPLDLFASGDARWLGVRPAGMPEQPRVLLVSVPYALKAADADTIGGRPATAFVLAATPGAATEAATSSGAPLPPAPAGSGTVNFVPLWTPDGNTLGNSVLFQSGSGATAKLGVNTTTPASTLDVKGAATVRGTFSLPNTAPATAAAGKTSQPLNFTASSFKSGGAAVNQTFQWKAEPAGNNTANPSGTLNLLFGSGATAPAETGLKIASNGIFTFAPTQTFPGAVTSVTAGGDLSGGGSGGNITLSLNRASTDGRYAQLGAANLFTQPQVIQGNATINHIDNTGNGLRLDVINPSTAISAFAVVNTTANATSTDLYSDGTGGGPLHRPSGIVGTFTNHPLGLITNDVPRIYIDPSGAVGVPTTTPQALLNVNQGASANTLLVGSVSKGIMLRDTGAALDLESLGAPLYINNTSLQPLFLNPAGGRVQIGTTGATYATLNVGATHDPNGNFYSASFTNDVIVLGNLDVSGSKNFRIDHPLDPANKYLRHAAIESSEVLNMYTGNVRLDDKGEAAVTFPAWFEAVNIDYRYQLTAIGAPGPNLYIAKEIEDGAFRIAGGTPGMRVSWQVTCLRNDPYMRAHPMVVEQDKPATEVGFYGHPELYGQPAEKGILFPEHAAFLEKQKAAANK